MNRIFIGLLIFISGCNKLENHENDGVYAGALIATPVAWVIDGNEVTIHTVGSVHKEAIEHGNGFVTLKSNGGFFKIVNDSESGEKYLSYNGGLMTTKLIFISKRTDLSVSEMQEMLTKANPFK